MISPLVTTDEITWANEEAVAREKGAVHKIEKPWVLDKINTAMREEPDGYPAYENIEKALAIIIHGLAKLKPFKNLNKLTITILMGTMLTEAGYDIIRGQERAIEKMINQAERGRLNIRQIEMALKHSIHKISSSYGYKHGQALETGFEEDRGI